MVEMQFQTKHLDFLRKVAIISVVINLIPECWRSYTEGTFANIELSDFFVVVWKGVI